MKYRGGKINGLRYSVLGIGAMRYTSEENALGSSINP